MAGGGGHKTTILYKSSFPDTASNEFLHNEVRVFTSGTQLQLPQ